MLVKQEYPINRVSHSIGQINTKGYRSSSCGRTRNGNDNKRKTYEIVSEDTNNKTKTLLDKSERFASFSTLDGSFSINNQFNYCKGNHFPRNNSVDQSKYMLQYNQLVNKKNKPIDIKNHNVDVLNMRYIDIGSNNYFLACRPRFDNVIKYNKRAQDYYQGIPLSKGNKGWSIGAVAKIYKLRKEFNKLLNKK